MNSKVTVFLVAGFGCWGASQIVAAAPQAVSIVLYLVGAGCLAAALYLYVRSQFSK